MELASLVRNSAGRLLLCRRRGIERASSSALFGALGGMGPQLTHSYLQPEGGVGAGIVLDLLFQTRRFKRAREEDLQVPVPASCFTLRKYNHADRHSGLWSDGRQAGDDFRARRS